ncbi:MAG: RsmB/NOP family class I SAM-dependent RNA methyltransferase, partial [Paracoccaceae bacterium]
LAEPLRAALGDEFEVVMQVMRHRAPVFLRVNAGKATLAEAIKALCADGIAVVPHGLASFALQVTGNERKLQASEAYLSGMVELQDAASQAVVEALPLSDGMRVLDYCAGGGGKTLAMAARARLRLWAHDAAPGRMRDLGVRAVRAGVEVTTVENPALAAPYDLILTDVPCSGSGSWRRDPAGKWALTPARLAELQGIQADILDRSAGLLSPRGTLAYATCSLLREENEAQIAAFLGRNHGWRQVSIRRFTPLQGGDGFFVALLTRKSGESTQP